MLRLEKLEKEGMDHKQALFWHPAVKEVTFIRLNRKLQSFALAEERAEHVQFLKGVVSQLLEVFSF